MTKSLTALQVEKSKPNGKRQQIADGAGLYLIVQPSGAKSWAVYYRFNGAQKKLTLGAYPEVSLSEAREQALAIRIKIGRGNDPVEEKVAVKEAVKAEAKAVQAKAAADQRYLTKNAVADWIAKDQRENRTADEVRRTVEKNFLAVLSLGETVTIGDRDIRTITRREIIALVDKRAETAPIGARRLHAFIHRLLRWASGRPAYVEVNVLAGVDKPGHENARDRVLSDAELRWVWTAAHEKGFPFGTIAQLLILTGQRIGEVTGLRRSELDLDARIWTLPATRSKNGRQHVIPLSDAVLEIIKGVPNIEGSGLLFTTNGRTEVSGWSKVKDWFDARIAVLASAEGKTVEHWTWHDLRRTVVTGLNTRQVLPHVVEAVVNHITGGAKASVAGVYNHAQYLHEKDEALQLWATHVGRVVSIYGSLFVKDARDSDVIEV